MPKLKLTDVALQRIKNPEGRKQVDYWDTLVPAFGLRASYLGARSWLTMVRILEKGAWKQTRITFGKFPAMSLADARERARNIQQEAAEGKDPRRSSLIRRVEIEKNSLETFATVRSRYIQQYCQKHLKAKTAAEYERCLAVNFRDWDTLPITEITRKQIIALLDQVVEDGTPIKANRMLNYLSAMMNWAVSKDILEVAPTAKVVAPAPEVSRERALTETEIKILWKALEPEKTFGPLVRFLLLTGQRREEVAQMKWRELNLNCEEPYWDIPRERVKMDRPHRVPLSPMAIEVLRKVPKIGKEFVFTTNGSTPVSGFSRVKDRLDRNITKIVAAEETPEAFEEGWVFHDLRRTCATQMAELGASRDVVELILNHRSGTRSGVAGIYNRSELMPERRRALNNLADYIRGIVEPEDRPAPAVPRLSIVEASI